MTKLCQLCPLFILCQLCPMGQLGPVFAKIDKSNVAVAQLFFFKLSMDPLVGNECHISIFSGLGGHGLSFCSLGQ